MNTAKVAQYAFWIAPGILQAALVILMLRRNLRQEFPLFFAYTVVQVVRFAVLFPLAHSSNYDNYFYAYWTFGAISTLMGLMVVREIFFYSFKPYESLAELGRVLFRWAVLIMLAVSVLMAMSTWSESLGEAMLTFVLILDRSVRLMQAGLLFFMLLFCEPLGLTMRNRVFGIAAAFGAYAAVEVIFLTVAAAAPQTVFPNLGTIKAAVYTGACATWLVYMWRPEPERALAREMEPLFAKWNAALMPHFQPQAQNYFISDIDATVDRILKRNN